MSSTTGTNTQTLKIERMAYGADAIAHNDDGKTVFVSGAIAGDVAEVEITHDGKTFCNGVARSIVEPSPSRTAPACPYATVCGGCPWASMSYEAQVEAKRTNVVDSLVRIAHMDPSEAEALVGPCETPGKQWGYRNKIELAFQRQGNRVAVGMHTHASHAGDVPSVVRVDACPLLDAPNKKLVKAVSGALGYVAGSSDLELDRVGIRVSRHTKDVEIALWDTPGPFARSRVAKVVMDATNATSIVRVLSKGPKKARKVTGVEVLKGRGHWRERVGSHTMALSAPSFFQVNTAGAQRLTELVLEGLDPSMEDEAMDLYCGAGTFTLPLADKCGWVSAVESYGPAVRDLRRNLNAANLNNVEPIGGDANREFPDDEADVIVVDPPRAGLAADVVDKLCAQPARAIVYVSCDPATLARDLARFAQYGTYSPMRITPVDLFPQTYHVENVCLLART